MGTTHACGARVPTLNRQARHYSHLALLISELSGQTRSDPRLRGQCPLSARQVIE